MTSAMEGLIARENFKLIDGKLVFVNCTVVFRRGGCLYQATSPCRQVAPSSIQDLQNITPIAPEDYQPLVPDDAFIAHDPALYYVKVPNLLAQNGPSSLTQPILQDLAVCEMLRKRPHPNLARYHGCIVSRGRVDGLCFMHYPQSLTSLLNPGHLNKVDFITSLETRKRKAGTARYLDSIELGLRHLHSLGFNHNDLNPANIMITEDDIPVIIDFDSATAPGASLQNVKRTHGWFDHRVVVSQQSNDLDALAEIRIWLTGSSPNEYRFDL